MVDLYLFIEIYGWKKMSTNMQSWKIVWRQSGSILIILCNKTQNFDFFILKETILIF